MRDDAALRSLPVVVLTGKDLTPADYARLNGSAQRILRKGADMGRLVPRRAREPGGERLRRRERPGGPRHAMARILIAEDSPDIRALVELLLAAEGHQISSVTDGRAAVEAARRTQPDLVLMDLSLPLLSGWEAARQIRADPATAEIPILAVTAHAMHGDRERALAAGCNGFIAKPINEETFASDVSGFLNERPLSARRAVVPFRPQGERARPDSRRRRPAGRGRVAAGGSVGGRSRGRRGHDRGRGRALVEDEPFELAIVDVMLGADSGYSLTASLTSKSEDYLPVLLVTGGTIDRERGFHAGADDFIGKPIESVELRARARSLIRVGRAIREQRRVGRERSEAYRKLEELDRLKSGFLSTVSHELRTPLNTIILLAHRLEKVPATRRGLRAAGRATSGFCARPPRRSGR